MPRGSAASARKILRLTLDDYKTWAEPSTQGFEKASKLLFGLKIFSSRDLPYRTQVTPLAAILAVLWASKADTDGVRAKLARWYWCGVFGELYWQPVETQFAKDLPEFLAWLDEGPEQGHRILSQHLNRTFSRYSSLAAHFIRLISIPFRQLVSRFSSPRANRRITLRLAGA